MPKKVFITGSNGQLGRELKKQLEAKKIPNAGYDIPELDITDYESARELVAKENPDVIINCAAMTNVDGCETDEAGARSINSEGARNMARIAKERAIPIVQVSTDYIFDGEGIREEGALRPYLESDLPNPKSVYGETKLEGERAVAETTDDYFIVRTAWLYGDGHNFVKTMLKLADTHPEVSVVGDQLGSPTSTVDLAGAILDLIETDAYGVYHATNEGVTSWAEFAEAIFDEAGLDTKVNTVTSEEYEKLAGRPVAKRPSYSVLENSELERLGLNTFRDWRESLREYITELK